MNFIHKDSLLQLHDGGCIEVKNLFNGIALLGANNKPLYVKKIIHRNIDCVRVVPKKGNAFIVGLKTIMSVRNYVKSKHETITDPHVNTNVHNIAIPTLHRFKEDFYLWKKHNVYYHRKPIKLDPYFFGLWLGDGTSTQPKITNDDPEVFDFVKNYAHSLGMRYTENKKHRYCYIAKPAYSNFNLITDRLKYYGVYNNKHIPIDYLYNNARTRLRLLAGVIDSDGTYNNKSNAFIIVMTRKLLSEDIYKVSKSLGFKTSFKQTVSKMLRKDGSLYQVDSWQVIISGHIDEIPTKITRKKARARISKTDYLITKFITQNVGKQDVCGIEFHDFGSKAILLDDLTVINT